MNIKIENQSDRVKVIEEIQRLSLEKKWTVKIEVQKLIRSIPLGRLATTQDQSNGILFLLSSLSNYITGSSINIDGGQI